MDMKHMSYEAAVADLEAHPEKRLFWRSGWAYRGATEYEVSRDPSKYPQTKMVCIDLRMSRRVIASWKDELKAKYEWACLVTCDRNDEREMHLNGLSCNDLE
jgi:hypothetical protein